MLTGAFPQAATLASLTPAALASFVLLPKKVIASTLSIKAPLLLDFSNIIVRGIPKSRKIRIT